MQDRIDSILNVLESISTSVNEEYEAAEDSCNCDGLHDNDCAVTLLVSKHTKELCNA